MKILHNVLVHKMDDAFGACTALAWEGSRIAAVEEEAELLSRYPAAEKVDGKGCSVLPGFIDPHIHFISGLLYRGALSVAPQDAPTLESLENLLRESARDLPADRWVVAQGYDAALFPGRRGPTRHHLDRACPHNPAVVIHYSFHECVANSRALALAGIGRTTPQPRAGEIKKDTRGEPTGELIEMAMSPVERIAGESLIENTKDELWQRFSAFRGSLFSHGITRFGDPAVTSAYQAVYRQALQSDLLRMPVVIYPAADRGLFEMPWDRLQHEPTGAGSDRLRVGPLKVFLDGADRCGMVFDPGQFAALSLAMAARCIRAGSLAPLQAAAPGSIRLGRDGKVHIGTMMVRPDECVELAMRAVENGFTLAFHAIGNQAVELALDTVARVRSRHADHPPPRIEHGLFMDDDLIRRTADLGIAIVTQPCFLTNIDSHNLPSLPNIKQMPLRSLIDAGVRVAGGSDWPIASERPLDAIEKAVTRAGRGDRKLQIAEAITINEALAMYTREAAHALGCENEVGILEPGKRADFILLSKDPLQIKEGHWSDLQVEKTYLAGEQVYSRQE